MVVLLALAVIAHEHELLTGMLAGATVVPLGGLIKLWRERR